MPKFKRPGARPIIRGPETWKTLVRCRYPTAQITVEDGTGKTYGEVGDLTAHTGPDMQADVVGTYSPGQGGWVSKPGRTAPTTWKRNENDNP